MSDNWLRLIPRDTGALIPKGADKRAKAIVKKLFPRADEISVQRFDELEFIEPGSNMGEIACPSCGKEVSDWWMEALGKWHEEGKKTLVRRSPCCNNSTSLDQFKFEWPMGFARVVIDVMNPGRKDTAKDIAAIENAVSCPLRVIWQHL
jgi:hypothetical protein